MSAPRCVSFVISPSDHGTLIVSRNDYAENDQGTIGVGAHIFRGQSYEKDEIKLVLDLLSKRRQLYQQHLVAIDCGANIGIHTLEWARHMHGWGEVHAFEAQERIFYALAGNVAINNCFNARVFWSAIGERVGKIRVPHINYFAPGSYGSLELKQSEDNEDIGQPINYDAKSTYEVDMVSIDSLKLPKVDFIKIDIEGMEMEALAGARKTLNKHKPMLLVEHMKSDEMRIKAFLEDSSYNCFQIGINLLAVHKTDKLKVNME